jgi:hypothetical protein
LRFSFSHLIIAIEIDKGYCELKVFRFILLFGITSMLFLINGCNDTPNSIGNGSLNKKVDYGTVVIDTFYATDHATVPNLISTVSADRFMLGQYKTYQAWTCLKFYSWPDSLIGARIIGATIQLKGVYHFGDSLAPLTFNVYRAKSNLFLSDSLTYDSLTLNSVNSANGIYYNSNNPIQVSYSTAPFGDTDAIAINILDTTMLREWFSTNTDTTDLNDGLVFRPTNSNIIKGFYSFNNSDTSVTPTLYITYVDTNGIPYYDYPLKVGLAEYVSTVNQASLITDNNLMYIQNGISYRGLVSFDSLAKIASVWPVSIFRAELQVTLNSSVSVAHDSLYALSVGPTGVSDGVTYAISQRDSSSSPPMYSFDARQIAIRWLSNASIRKVAMSGLGENTSFGLFKLYGTGVHRPRIIITYALQR